MLSRHACAFSTHALSKNIVSLAARAAQKPPRYHPRQLYHSLPSAPVLSANFSPSSIPHSPLGLRTSLPPDSQPDPNQPDSPETPDHEWEIRTGRAIYVIQETLPTFFSTGLITSIDKATGAPRSSAHLTLPLDWQAYSEDIESIYSPSVRLAYTPPLALPSPLPRTLHVEGLPLYMASSAFVRHTMNALYADLSVALTKVVVNAPPAHASKADGKPSISREKSLVVRMTVTGTARVSGSPGEWEIEATYTFSPISGLIQTHIVDSIHPAPHEAAYLSLDKMFGLGWDAHRERNAPTPGAACAGKPGGKVGA